MLALPGGSCGSAATTRLRWLPGACGGPTGTAGLAGANGCLASRKSIGDDLSVSNGDAQPNVTVVTAPREVDIATAPELLHRIADACAQHPAKVVVDFTTATFCDSSAVHVLLDAAESTCAEGCVLQVRPNALLSKILRVLGLPEQFA